MTNRVIANDGSVYHIDNYVKCQKWIMGITHCSDLKGNKIKVKFQERYIYNEIIGLSRHDGHCYMTVQMICDDYGFSRTVAKKYLQQLENLGWIKREQKSRQSAYKCTPLKLYRTDFDIPRIIKNTSAWKGTNRDVNGCIQSKAGQYISPEILAKMKAQSEQCYTNDAANVDLPVATYTDYDSKEFEEERLKKEALQAEHRELKKQIDEAKRAIESLIPF